MTTFEKLNEINRLCKNSLQVGCYSGGWSINSFKDDTHLSIDIKYPYFRDKSLTKLVNKAYKYVIDREGEN